MSPDTLFAAIEQRQLATMGAYARNHHGVGIRPLTPEEAREAARRHGRGRACGADSVPRVRVRPAVVRQPSCCCDCGADITHRSSLAERCVSCAEKRRAAWQRLWERNERKVKTATCPGCGVAIRPRAGSSGMCRSCYAAERRAS